MHTPTCPCCSHTLLRHARSGEIYWFCRHCYQEMPTLATNVASWTKSKAYVGFSTAVLDKISSAPSTLGTTQTAPYCLIA